MWPFGKREGTRKEMLTRGELIAVIIAAFALAASVGVARWSWLILDEQIRLREDFEALRNEQMQTQIQYDVWLERLREEGRAMRAALDERGQ